MNFIQFKQSRYNSVPYDLKNNPFGFKYENGCDISAHLPFLEFIASQCNHVTEFGTRECYSTVAFLAGCKGKVVSYDIKSYPAIIELKYYELPCLWEFKQQSTIDPELKIEETDFLFIDSLHTYDQVKQELKQAKYVKKFLGFHDTFSQGEMSLDMPGTKGIIPALVEFLNENHDWKVVYHVIFNHGLTLLQRTT